MFRNPIPRSQLWPWEYLYYFAQTRKDAILGAACLVLRTRTQTLVSWIQRSRDFVNAPNLGRQPEPVCSLTICVFAFAMAMENGGNDNTLLLRLCKYDNIIRLLWSYVYYPFNSWFGACQVKVLSLSLWFLLKEVSCHFMPYGEAHMSRNWGNAS